MTRAIQHVSERAMPDSQAEPPATAPPLDREKMKTPTSEPTRLWPDDDNDDIASLHQSTDHRRRYPNPVTVAHAPPPGSQPIHVRLKTDDNHESGQSSSAPALLNNLGNGGYAGIRVGEAAEQPLANHSRINEAGDSVPSSQDSVTKAVQNLRISDYPTASAALSAPPPPTMVNQVRSRSRRSHSILPPRSHAEHGSKNTEDSNFSQKALGNCAVSTVRPASFVASATLSEPTPSAPR